jgi:hypothetical protein
VRHDGALRWSMFALYVGSEMSTNTGFRPYRSSGLTVVGKQAATVTISSPGFQ